MTPTVPSATTTTTLSPYAHSATRYCLHQPILQQQPQPCPCLFSRNNTSLSPLVHPAIQNTISSPSTCSVTTVNTILFLSVHSATTNTSGIKIQGEEGKGESGTLHFCCAFHCQNAAALIKTVSRIIPFTV